MAERTPPDTAKRPFEVALQLHRIGPDEVPAEPQSDITLECGLAAKYSQ